MLELRARFDEEANLDWKTELEEAGVKVLIGIPRFESACQALPDKKKNK